MAGGVARDLNNILSGIFAYRDVILMALPDDSGLWKMVLVVQNIATSNVFLDEATAVEHSLVPGETLLLTLSDTGKRLSETEKTAPAKAAIKLGAHDFLIKPYSIAQLDSMLGEALAQ